MNEAEYRSAHSKFMDDLVARLASMSIQLLEHHYAYETFGSWFIVCPASGSQLRIVFDGKESMMHIEKRSDMPWQGPWKIAASYPTTREVNPADICRYIVAALKPA